MMMMSKGELSLDSFISEFKENHAPADSIENSKHLRSTQDISDILEDFTGLQYPKDEIVEEMLRQGYKYKLIDDQFVWLTL